MPTKANQTLDNHQALGVWMNAGWWLIQVGTAKGADLSFKEGDPWSKCLYQYKFSPFWENVHARTSFLQ